MFSNLSSKTGTKLFCHRSLGRIKRKEFFGFFWKKWEYFNLLLKCYDLYSLHTSHSSKNSYFLSAFALFFHGCFPSSTMLVFEDLVAFYLEKSNRNSQELTACPLENGHLPGFFERKIPPQMSYVIFGGPFSCQFGAFPQKVWILKKFKKPCKFSNTNLIRHCVGISHVQTMWFKDRQLQYLLQGLIINYASIQVLGNVNAFSCQKRQFT